MPKVTLNDLGSGYASSALLDENFDTIETAFDNTLSRDGSTPNQMEAQLDMNSNRIINLDDPVNDQDAATKAWILDQEGNAAQDAIDAAASADAAADSEAAALASENNAEAWATQLDSLVESTDYSSKEWAIGTTVGDGSSKEWATNPEDDAVGDAAGFSALHYAAKAQAAAAALTIPDSVIYFHPQVLMTDVTVPAEYNGWVVGPWSVDAGATLTVEAGANFYVQADPATLVTTAEADVEYLTPSSGLKVANNLSDLDDVATARGNLDLASGSGTFAVTNQTGCSVTQRAYNYIQVGNMVLVTGTCRVDNTQGTAEVIEFDITLPVGAQDGDAKGHISGVDTTADETLAGLITGAGEVLAMAHSTGNFDCGFSFTYSITL